MKELESDTLKMIEEGTAAAEDLENDEEDGDDDPDEDLDFWFKI